MSNIVQKPLPVCNFFDFIIISMQRDIMCYQQSHLRILFHFIYCLTTNSVLYFAIEQLFIGEYRMYLDLLNFYLKTSH